MAEKLPVIEESVKRLEFSDVHLHDYLKIVTGQNDEVWRYNFIIDKAGHWPHGQLNATSPQGEVPGTFGFELQGCGIWTDRRQNPVQKQDRGFTPYYDGLIVGDFMWGKFDGQDERAVFDKPGQQISEIVHVPYRENALLQTLGNASGALSVTQIAELLPMQDSEFTTKVIREVLKKLVASGLVAFIQKKAQLFELAVN